MKSNFNTENQRTKFKLEHNLELIGNIFTVSILENTLNQTKREKNIVKHST